MTQRVVATAFLTACTAAAVACSPGSPAAGPGSASQAATPATATAFAARASSAVPDHVVIVMLENKDEADVLREGPYLASLAASGATLTDMLSAQHVDYRE